MYNEQNLYPSHSHLSSARGNSPTYVLPIVHCPFSHFLHQPQPRRNTKLCLHAAHCVLLIVLFHATSCSRKQVCPDPLQVELCSSSWAPAAAEEEEGTGIPKKHAAPPPKKHEDQCSQIRFVPPLPVFCKSLLRSCVL